MAPSFHCSAIPSGPEANEERGGLGLRPFMNFSEIYPLIKEPCQSQYNPKNLLEKNEKINPKSDPLGHSVFIQEKQHDGETVKNIYNRHHDDPIDGHESYTTYGQK